MAQIGDLPALSRYPSRPARRIRHHARLRRSQYRTSAAAVRQRRQLRQPAAAAVGGRRRTTAAPGPSLPIGPGGGEPAAELPALVTGQPVQRTGPACPRQAGTPLSQLRQQAKRTASRHMRLASSSCHRIDAWWPERRAVRDGRMPPGRSRLRADVCSVRSGHSAPGSDCNLLGRGGTGAAGVCAFWRRWVNRARGERG